MVVVRKKHYKIIGVISVYIGEAALKWLYNVSEGLNKTFRRVSVCLKCIFTEHSEVQVDG